MKHFKFYISKLVSQPISLSFRQSIRLFINMLQNRYCLLLDSCNKTYNREYKHLSELSCFLEPVAIETLLPVVSQIASTTELYMDHYFDLLGSGWTQVNRGMKCNGHEGILYHSKTDLNVDYKGNWLSKVINYSNLKKSKKIWAIIFSKNGEVIPVEDYQPIDWQIDFKSGFRWKETTWYKKIKYGHKPGVDVKVPWELARMQHLPQFVWAYILSGYMQKHRNPKAKNKAYITQLSKLKWKKPDQYVFEFQNQIMDFISTNPPRYGVNWSCTMDVGIRVANWLVTYDLFRSNGATFNDKFETIFVRSIYDHGLHIINNLEWFDELCSNHYLANITGLLFVSAYLPCTPETNSWLAFSVKELLHETQSQFYQDGANFEASTSYHRLSSEMVVYATALISALTEEKKTVLTKYNYSSLKFVPRPDDTTARKPYPLPVEHYKKIYKMASFVKHISKPDNKIVQIGDNDNGRFFKLQPSYDKLLTHEAKSKYANLKSYKSLPDNATFWDENILDHRHLVGAINGFFDDPQLNCSDPEFIIDKSVISSFIRPEKHLIRAVTISDDSQPLEINNDNDFTEFNHNRIDQIIRIPVHGYNIQKGLIHYAYPDFGLYIFKSDRFFLSVRCGSSGQNGNGGHAHNDQLSIELHSDGLDIISDPGTYTYTPFPEQRNKFRSFLCHNGHSLLNKEPESLSIGLFTLGNLTKSKCISFTPHQFTGELKIKNRIYVRSIQIHSSEIIIEDSLICTDKPLKQNFQPINTETVRKNTCIYSNGYGKLIHINRNNCCIDSFY